MEHLPPAVRAKAIEIANALLDAGHDDGFAIRVGIARARAWDEGMHSRRDREDTG
jgi:uncharacterized protein YdaT